MAICLDFLPKSSEDLVQLAKQIDLEFIMILVFPQTSIVSPMELVKTQMQVRDNLFGP